MVLDDNGVEGVNVIYTMKDCYGGKKRLTRCVRSLWASWSHSLVHPLAPVVSTYPIDYIVY